MAIDAIINGWTFQVVAGVHLFIKNIKDIERFKFEGEEDIIYKKNNGNKIYVEAKASKSPKDKVKRHITYHLEGCLKKYKKKDYAGIYDYIYITNIMYPFNDDEIYLNTQFSNYKNLSKGQKKKINEFLKEPKTSNFNVTRLQYDEDNKLLAIDNGLHKLLSSIDSKSLKYKTEEILTKWFVSVFMNGTKKSVYITKKEMVWKIILVELKDNITEFLNDINMYPHEEIVIKNYYYDFIEPFENKLQMINAIYYEYIKDIELNQFDSNEYYKKYASVCYPEIDKILPNIKDIEKEMLAKLLVVNIVKKHNFIKQIKDVTTHENN